MSKDQELSLSMNVNGESKVPPGFRFHPTEEELLNYYLRKKVAYEKIDLDVIREVDLNKLEPWDIQVECRIGSTPQNDWYFFSHKDKKYPSGTRTNRATAVGFWKATGRDKIIHSSLRRIGMRKTLVFYKGRAPHGQKSDWIMHEYRLDDSTITTQNYTYGSNYLCDSIQEDGWVVCRVFTKKNYHKVVDQSPQMSSSAPSIATTPQMQSLKKDDQFPTFINGRSFNQENFLHIPRLDNASGHLIGSGAIVNQGSNFTAHNTMTNLLTKVEHSRDNEHLDNWADVDRLVASQLNGQAPTSKHMFACYDEPSEDICFPLDDDDQEPPPLSLMVKPYETTYTGEISLWNFAKSSSQSSSPDPFYPLSV